MERQLERRGGRRDLRECVQSLLAIASSFTNAGSFGCPVSGLERVLCSFFPHLAFERMKGEAFSVLRQSVWVQQFERLSDPCVQSTTAVVEKTSVGDLVRQCMLEGVLGLREEKLLVQELGRLQAGQSLP